MKKIFINAVKGIVKKFGGPLFFSTKSYSQEGEDIVVKRFFDGREIGFYVDVGCHHPFRFSNTYLFYKKGWRGICIDPLPGTANLFKKWRGRDICVEVGVSSHPSSLNYFMFNEPALNSFDENVARNRDGLTGYKIIGVKPVNTFPLGDIIEKNLDDKSQKISFFSIDVEGLDLQVLQSNNWEKFRPEIIIAECLDMDLSSLSKDPVVSFLSEKGYGLYAKTGNSVIFKDEGI